MISNQSSIKRFRRFVAWIVIIAASLSLTLLFGYKKIGDVMPNQTPIETYIGENGKSFVERNASIAKIDRQPAGLNFYEIHWPFRSMGSIIFKNGKKSFPVPNVLSFMGTEDMDLQNEGIYEISIESSISNADKIMHDEARAKTMAYLQAILQLGWKPTIPPSMARIRGKDMNDYLLRTGNYTTLDPRYIPTLSEWMAYKDRTTWAFYDDHVFLTVQIARDQTLIDPLKPGAYLLSTNARSEKEHFRRYVDGMERAHWEQLIPAALEEMERSRKLREVEFHAEGIAIDETYVDPIPSDLRMH